MITDPEGRKLVTAEVVSNLIPIPGADLIEVAIVRGWSVVVRKGDFSVGSKVAYYEIDAALPLCDPLYASLAPRGKRLFEGDYYHVLRTIRLRGQYSQGLVLPLGLLVSGDYPPGYDLTPVLGLGKWEPDVPAGSGDIIGPFLSRYARVTGSERAQNLEQIWPLILEQEWVATEKIDGCLMAETPISLPGGGSVPIRDVRVGDVVLGMDESGNVVPSKVLNVFNNGLTADWLKVKGRRINRGRGHSTFSIKATSNHRFFVPGSGYVEARHLSAGDRVLCLHYNITTTSEVEIDSVENHSMLLKNGLAGMKARKYDIETDTHNFFASGILVHNSSATLIRDNEGTLRVCSRNWEIARGDNLYWNTVLKWFGMGDSIDLPPGAVVQFEIAGPGIQKNPLNLPRLTPFIFNHPAGMESIGGHPISRFKVPSFNLKLPQTIQEAVQQADGIKSLVTPGRLAEGVVWHQQGGETLRELDYRRNFKVISNRYLLKPE